MLRYCFHSPSIIPLLASDSDATTVPASTPEARKMALQKVAEAKADKSSDTKDATAKSTAQLPRRLQSQALLEDPAGTEHLLKVKKSASSETMLYPVPEVKATAVKAKAQPNQPAKEEKGTTARAVRECLARSNTAEIAAVPAEEAVAIPEEIEEAPESKRKSRKTSKETPQAPAAAATSEKTPETEKKTTKRKTSTGTTEAPKALEKKAAEKKAPEKKAPEKKAPEKKEKKTCEEPPKADEKKTSKGQPEVDPPEAEADDAESSSEDTQEILLKEQQVKAKREAHARFMRFRRSLSSASSRSQ